MGSKRSEKFFDASSNTIPKTPEHFIGRQEKTYMSNDVADMQITLKNIDVTATEEHIQCKLIPLSSIKKIVQHPDNTPNNKNKVPFLYPSF